MDLKPLGIGRMYCGENIPSSSGNSLQHLRHPLVEYRNEQPECSAQMLHAPQLHYSFSCSLTQTLTHTHTHIVSEREMPRNLHAHSNKEHSFMN
jgi:hypothetical protein